MPTPVWLYWPNLIGYVRVLSGIAAFAYSFTETFQQQTAVEGGGEKNGANSSSLLSPLSYFVYLYTFSYALDALDGVAARRFKQESTFGAVLDMVTDRVCTAGLLSALAHVAPATELWGWSKTVYVWLIMLDVGSHWLQMYR